MTALKTLSACLAAAAVVACTSSQPASAVTIDRIVALSDGDHAASTYVDGVLAPAEAGHRDLLTTISVRAGAVSTAQVEVSNSVTAAPEVLAMSPDGATAFVTERLGQRRPGDTKADQLPAGHRLFAVDVSDFGSPVLTDTATIASSPEALAVSPDGRHVAVVSNAVGAAVLALVPWRGTGFGDPLQFDLAELGITGDADGPRGGVLATNVQWHPTGRALAINVATRNRVAFMMVDTPPTGVPTLRPWGDPVATGVDPFVGRFTPDGRHYLTSDWGRNFAATEMSERLPAVRSRITVVDVSGGGSDSLPRVVASAESDKSAEGLAISPDGQWVATVNMRGTALPPDSPAYDEDASVSLLRRDADRGGLTKVGDYPLSGVLPEGGAFDSSGEYFLATVFEGRDGTSDGAGLQVFRVGPNDAPGLTPAQRIPLPHGVHHVAVG